LRVEVSSIYPANHDQGITLRQAALVAGFGLLIMSFAAPSRNFLSTQNWW